MADLTDHSRRGESQLGNLTRWVDSLLGKPYHKFCSDRTWSPAANLYESPTSYHAVFDLAGIDPGDIDLYVDKGVLHLTGKRLAPAMPEQPNCIVHSMEIDQGEFCRRVTLPGDVQVDSIQAVYRAGLLVVELPREV
ncbi:MAG: Hsp20/alpha crystallin family protein [Phycisphaerae bacterium]